MSETASEARPATVKAMSERVLIHYKARSGAHVTLHRDHGDLGRELLRLYRRRTEARAIDAETRERVGSVERDRDDGRWVYWYEVA